MQPRVVEPEAAPPEGEVIQQGWLTKQGAVVQNWKRRWFVLRQDALCYAPSPETPPSGVHRIAIDSTTQVQQARTLACGFSIWTPSASPRVFYIRADTPADLDEWLVALQKVVERVTPPVTQSLQVLLNGLDPTWRPRARTNEAIEFPSVIALHDFQARHPDELAFRAGDLIRVTQKFPDGWWKGQTGQPPRTGIFPSNHVEPCFTPAVIGSKRHGAESRTPPLSPRERDALEQSQSPPVLPPFPFERLSSSAEAITVRDWNTEYQDLVEKMRQAHVPGTLITEAEALETARAMHHLCDNFISEITSVVKIIVTEVGRSPQARAIQPTASDESGVWFFHNGIDYKMALPSSGKILLLERSAMLAVQQKIRMLWEPFAIKHDKKKGPSYQKGQGLFLPLFVVADFLGFRFMARARPPLGPHPAPVRDEPCILDMSYKLSRALNMADCRVVTGETTARWTFGPESLALYRGTDGRLYLPSAVNLVPHRFRPEHVLSHPTPIPWGGRSQTAVIADLSTRLHSFCIPQLGSTLTDRQTLPEILALCKARGINMRYLHVLRSAVYIPRVRALLLTEIVARLAKRAISDHLRDVIGRDGSRKAVQIAINIISLYFKHLRDSSLLIRGDAHSERAKTFWARLPQRVLEIFPGEEQLHLAKHTLLDSKAIDINLLADLIRKKLGVTLAPGAYEIEGIHVRVRVSPWAYKQEGYWSLELGDSSFANAQSLWSMAAELYQQASAIDPADHESWLRRGRCALQLDESLQALRLLSQALVLDPHSAEAWIGLGQVLQENVALAGEDYERAAVANNAEQRLVRSLPAAFTLLNAAVARSSSDRAEMAFHSMMARLEGEDLLAFATRTKDLLCCSLTVSYLLGRVHHSEIRFDERMALSPPSSPVADSVMRKLAGAAPAGSPHADPGWRMTDAFPGDLMRAFTEKDPAKKTLKLCRSALLDATAMLAAAEPQNRVQHDMQSVALSSLFLVSGLIDETYPMETEVNLTESAADLDVFHGHPTALFSNACIGAGLTRPLIVMLGASANGILHSEVDRLKAWTVLVRIAHTFRGQAELQSAGVYSAIVNAMRHDSTHSRKTLNCALQCLAWMLRRPEFLAFVVEHGGIEKQLLVLWEQFDAQYWDMVCVCLKRLAAHSLGIRRLLSAGVVERCGVVIDMSLSMIQNRFLSLPLPAYQGTRLSTSDWGRLILRDTVRLLTWVTHPAGGNVAARYLGKTNSIPLWKHIRVLLTDKALAQALGPEDSEFIRYGCWGFAYNSVYSSDVLMPQEDTVANLLGIGLDVISRAGDSQSLYHTLVAGILRSIGCVRPLALLDDKPRLLQHLDTLAQLASDYPPAFRDNNVPVRMWGIVKARGFKQAPRDLETKSVAVLQSIALSADGAGDIIRHGIAEEVFSLLVAAAAAAESGSMRTAAVHRKWLDNLLRIAGGLLQHGDGCSKLSAMPGMASEKVWEIISKRVAAIL